MASKKNYPQNNYPQNNAEKKSQVTKSARAKLTFPVGRIQSNLRKGRYADRIATGGAVYLAAVLEYLSAELLELAGETAKENQKQRIIPRHIMVAIKKDAEFAKLLANVQISEGGVIPFIHEELLPVNSKEKNGPKKNKLHKETDVQSQEM